MKIVFFVRKIHGVLGGMERQVISIAESLTKNGNQVHILSLDTATPIPFYEMKQDLHFHAVGIGDANEKTTLRNRVGRQWRTLQTLRRIKPDIGIAFMTGSLFYSRLPMWIIGKSLILAERNSPLIYKLTSVKSWRYTYFISMLFTRRIIVQFPRYKNGYPKFLRNRIVAIPNCVESRTQQYRSKEYPKNFTFAGRFSFQKRPTELIIAFSKLAAEYNDVELRLFGEGELLEEMSRTIMALPASVQSKIFVLPPTQDIDSILTVTDVLCVPSMWEGFPNVVAESLSAGIPVVGFRECDGLSDLLSHRINGWLVNEDENVVENLFAALKECYGDYQRLMENKALISLSVSQYTEKMTAKMWIKVTAKERKVLLFRNETK